MLLDINRPQPALPRAKALPIVVMGCAQTAATLGVATLLPGVVGWAYCVSLALLFVAVLRILGCDADSGLGSQVIRVVAALAIAIAFGVFTIILGVNYVVYVLGWQP